MNLQSALRAKDSRLKNLRFPKELKLGIEYSKVSNLKMDIDDTEKNPFGHWSRAIRGVDDETGRN